MMIHGYDIELGDSAVSIKEDSKNTPIDEKAGTAILMIGGAIVFFVITVFLPGRGNSPSVWENFTGQLQTASGHTSAVVHLTALGLLAACIAAIGLRLLFPSGEALRCDRNTFTFSKIPWFSLRGRWSTKSYPTSSIEDFRYDITARGKSAAFYGFRFAAGGRSHKLFSGISAPDAVPILAALRKLGLPVLENPDMDKLIANDSRNLDGDTSWMEHPTTPSGDYKPSSDQ